MSEVALELKSEVVEIRFGNERGNALLRSELKELNKAFTKTVKDKAVKAIVLRGNGRTFCSGAALNELAELKSQQAAEKFFNSIGDLLLTIVACPVPVISRVHGKAVGGGLGLIAATDYALASNDAAVRLSELAIGLGPFVIGPFLERKIGLANFAALSLDTAWRDAAWCKSTGLVSQVVAPDRLDAELDELTKKLSGSSREALSAFKGSLLRELPKLKAEVRKRAKLSAKLVMGKTAQESIQRFLTKQ